MYISEVPFKMIRTQIYLTDEERGRLRALACRQRRKQSVIIREAIDAFLNGITGANRATHLRQHRGMSKNRPLSAFREIREQVERNRPD